MKLASLAVLCAAFLTAAPAWAETVAAPVSAPITAPEPEPIKVMVVGMFHFDNPGLDYRNAKIDDMLAPARQAEIAAVSEALSRFQPTKVGVEWAPGRPDRPYGRYLDGSLPASPDEIVQVAFRIAKTNHLTKVYGLDMPMDLPFDPAVAFAESHGRQDIIEKITVVSEANVALQERILRDEGVAATLRMLNDSPRAMESHGLYRDILKLGAGADQPGLAVVLAWYQRNLGICANLLQAAQPGDRVAVFFGAGHLPLLEQCVRETPGYELVSALDYLPPA